MPVDALDGGGAAPVFGVHHRRDRDDQPAAGAHRHVPQVQGAQAVVRLQAHRDRKLLAAFPEHPGAAASHIGLDHLRYLADRQPEVGNLFPVDDQVLLRPPFAAADPHIFDFRYPFHDLLNVLSQPVGQIQIVAAQLQLQRLGAAGAEEAAQHPQAGLGFHPDFRPGDFSGDIAPDLVGQLETVDAAFIRAVESQFHFGIAIADLDGHMAHFVHRGRFSHDPLQLPQIFIHHCDVGTLGHLQIDTDLVGVGLGGQFHRQQRPEQEGDHQQQGGDGKDHLAVAEHPFQQSGITRLQPHEPVA